MDKGKSSMNYISQYAARIAETSLVISNSDNLTPETGYRYWKSYMSQKREVHPKSSNCRESLLCWEDKKWRGKWYDPEPTVWASEAAESSLLPMRLSRSVVPVPAQTLPTTASGHTEWEPRAHTGQWPLLPEAPARSQGGEKSFFPLPSSQLPANVSRW